ncbi:hypothetical protein [Sphingopyxis sp. GW247-27LB]|uniref:hypothetical protein n=1 Tax=Sphingopyxis sp. GW247-27LB TaxID=2012632 RepID=UPI001140C51D|nr:hypothetical protein [Sphingopyxis sp. GW247-27LB]
MSAALNRPAMTLADALYHGQWKASSGHPKGWRVTRQFFPPHPDYQRVAATGVTFLESEGKGGRLRLFRSWEAAQRVADKMNRENIR